LEICADKGSTKIANLMCLALLLDPATAQLAVARGAQGVVQLGNVGVVAAAQAGMDMLCQWELIGDYTNLLAKHIDVTIPKLAGVDQQPAHELMHPLWYYSRMAFPLKPVADIVFSLPCCASSGERSLGVLTSGLAKSSPPPIVHGRSTEVDLQVIKFNTLQLRRTQDDVEQDKHGVKTSGFESFVRPRELMSALHAADGRGFVMAGRSKPLSSLWRDVALAQPNHAMFLELPDWPVEHPQLEDPSRRCHDDDDDDDDDDGDEEGRRNRVGRDVCVGAGMERSGMIVSTIEDPQVAVTSSVVDQTDVDAEMRSSSSSQVQI
jgi:hypothetical protein